MAKKSNDYKIEGGSISKDFVASFKSEGEFMQEMSTSTYQHIFEGENREAKLKELYALANPAPAAPPAKPAK